MAFLLPENIPSRSGVPARLRQVAAAFRDWTPDDVTVWLRDATGYPYLVVLDPATGIMVIDAPALSASRKRRNKFARVFESLEMITIHDDIIKSTAVLKSGIDDRAIKRLEVKCVAAFPDLDEVPSEDLGLTEKGLELLARSDLAEGILPAAIARIFGDRDMRPLSRQEQDQARSVVNPEIILPQSRSEHLPLFQDPEIAPENVIKVMDREQERVAEHLGFGYRVLRGVAGSGKTLVLAHRARYLHRNWPQWRILILCYNRVLANALTEMVDSGGNVKVTNVDRLAYSMAGPKGGQRQGNERPDFDKLVGAAIQAAMRRPDQQLYDVVLVDEAQDFDHARLNLAYAMLKSDRRKLDLQNPDSDNFVMALDVAQNVYRRSGARWNPEGLDAQGRSRTARGRTSMFRKNYRNTREILEFAMNFLAGSRDWRHAAVDLEDAEALVPPEAANRSGPHPEVKECRDLRDEAEHIASAVGRLVEEGVSVADIVVMYGTYELEKSLYRAFEDRRLPYFRVQGRQDGREARDMAPKVNDAVRVSTLTSMKGLEFSRVFVGGVNYVEVRDADDADQFQASKSQLYAAFTRAMDELTVTVSGDGDIGRAVRSARSR